MRDWHTDGTKSVRLDSLLGGFHVSAVGVKQSSAEVGVQSQTMNACGAMKRQGLLIHVCVGFPALFEAENVAWCG